MSPGGTFLFARSASPVRAHHARSNAVVLPEPFGPVSTFILGAGLRSSWWNGPRFPARMRRMGPACFLSVLPANFSFPHCPGLACPCPGSPLRGRFPSCGPGRLVAHPAVSARLGSEDSPLVAPAHAGPAAVRGRACILLSVGAPVLFCLPGEMVGELVLVDALRHCPLFPPSRMGDFLPLGLAAWGFLPLGQAWWMRPSRGSASSSITQTAQRCPGSCFCAAAWAA